MQDKMGSHPSAERSIATHLLGEGSDPVTVSFTLNGQPAYVIAPPFASLADTLREELGLTGTKIGCEAGDCGACTVLLDGAQVCACLVATAQAEGASIDTVEGEGPDGVLDRLRAAFLAHGAAQCGICTPGMLMAAADLLSRHPAPDRTKVEDAIGGVLCRCTGYLKIVEAILEVGADQNQAANSSPVVSSACPGLDPGSNHGLADSTALRQAQGGGEFAERVVGARLPRVDGWPKVAGTDIFGADEAPADALWLRAVRSPHARARFALGDLAAVKARTPGLTAILTAADVPGANSFGIFPTLRDQPVLAPGHVRFRGEAILALVGSREAVESLADADLPITWHPEPPLTGIDAALAPGAPPLHAAFPDNVLARGKLRCGDVAAAHAGAAATAEGTFHTAFVEHAYIEPEAGFAVPIGAGPEHIPDRIEVTACTQAPYMDREETARVLGLGPSACASVRRPAAAASAASSTSPCSRCWRWPPGSRAAPCAWSTPARSPWPPPPSATPPPSARRLRLTRKAGSSPSNRRPISTRAPTPPGARRSRAGCRCTRKAPTRCPAS